MRETRDAPGCSTAALLVEPEAGSFLVLCRGHPAAGGSTSRGSAPVLTAAPAEAGIGTAVRNGKFEFVVTSVEPGTAEIGKAPISTKAQGEFVLVNVSVTNIGNEPQPFSGTDAKAFDSQGREF